MPDLLHNAILPDMRQLGGGGGSLMPRGGSGPAFLFFFFFVNSDLPPLPMHPISSPYFQLKPWLRASPPQIAPEAGELCSRNFSLARSHTHPLFPSWRLLPAPIQTQGRASDFFLKDMKTLEESETKGGEERNHIYYNSEIIGNNWEIPLPIILPFSTVNVRA